MADVTIPPTMISYDYPDGGLDPFDVDEAGTQHVLEARGWARAWVPGVDGVSWERPVHKAIPMGYRYLATLKTLHANPGAHREVPAFELDGSTRFFVRHLGRVGTSPAWRDRYRRPATSRSPIPLSHVVRASGNRWLHDPEYAEEIFDLLAFRP